MKTKAEILETHIKNLSLLPKLAVLQAMDEYAQQQSQAFAEWKDTNLYYMIKSDSELVWRNGGAEAYTTAELYAKFIEEQKGC